ncbi:MAG TPA: phospholipase D-like domain-containing protein [Nocardioides sp.]|nr:phospholipase D-like domain-containing protein [Nocardioides sp.]
MVAANGAPVHALPSAPAALVPAAQVARTTPKAPPTPPDHYVVRNGVRFNDPYGRDGHGMSMIRRHIIRTINSTTLGDHIFISSWNIRGKGYADALIAAHHRGVGVRIVMDHGNANQLAPNPDVSRIMRAFKGDAKRYPPNQSALVRCNGSCRGAHGIAHSKFFLFDHVGDRSWITMYGSNNATDVAANSQWNDMFTIANNKTVFDDFLSIFRQMVPDKNMGSKAYVHFAVDPTRAFNFYPNVGATAVADPDLQRLRQITCTGATGGTGVNGHTKVRIAQDALLGQRGINIAKRLVQMRNQGCDIRLIYSLLGGNARKVLVAGKVPMLQYSYDRNRDGMYDIYLHMKDMAISGVFRGKTDDRVVFNGSANWSPVALVSDEIVGEIHDARTTANYIDWIDYLWHHRPSSWGPVNLAPVSSSTSGGIDRPIVGRTVDPYALMRKEDM